MKSTIQKVGQIATVDRETVKYTFNVFKKKSFWLVASAILMLKCLFIPTYYSTDFEVHRNWMAITNNMSVESWYYDHTSQWTLDYPPFFAYFEYLLSKIANLIVPSALVLQAEPVFSLEILYFHRFTVIFTDFFYILAAGFSANCFETSSLNASGAEGLSLALLVNIPLLLVDNIHFQYNGFLTSFLLISIGFALKRTFLMAGFIFCVLLNFKHIYLYYAPAYITFFLAEYFTEGNFIHFALRGIQLAVVICVPFVASFGIFIYRDGMDAVAQIVKRMFPFQRGLTHAYWAPNLWACYNFFDFCFFKLLKALRRIPFEAPPPLYTSGLVQEYSHSILPNISAKTTLICTSLLLLPMTMFLNKKFFSKNKIAAVLTHSAFAFFLAGYHVHEKGIIMIMVPYTVLAFSDHRYVIPWINLSLAANISLFPLFFTSFENLIKVTLTFFSHFFLIAIVEHTCRFPEKRSLLKHFYPLALIAVQCYTLLFHQILFGSVYGFLPLMLTSTSTAFAVVFSFAEFIFITYLKKPKPMFDMSDQSL